MKAIIFDFNGTLFYDSHIHAYAWRNFIAKKLGREVSDEEMEYGVQGRSNPAILTHFLGEGFTPEELERMGHEKEAWYRKECARRPDELRLAKGAAELFDLLKEKNIPFAIATSSEILNVQFYFNTFGLERWFARDHVVYDDGIMRSKPHPDIYLKTAAALGVDMKDCVVFEDSVSGLAAAKVAGAGRIFAVDSLVKPSMYEGIEGIHKMIRDYSDITIEEIGIDI